jgi:transposase-like protein
MARSQPWSDETRREALRLYVAVGPAEACRQTGVGRSTLHRWVAQAGLQPVVSEPSRSAAPLDLGPLPSWEARQSDTAALLAEAVHRMLGQVVAQLQAGRPVQYHHAATFTGMALEWLARLRARGVR